MIVPIRCFTCNKMLADKWMYYVDECAKADAKATAAAAAAAAAATTTATPAAVTTARGDAPGPDGKTERGRILDRMGIHDQCCRIVMLTTVDITSVI